MDNIKIVITSGFLLISSLILAQNDTICLYERFFEAGKIAYYDNNFDDARSQFNAAKYCPDKNLDSLNIWLEKVNQANITFLRELGAANERLARMAEYNRLNTIAGIEVDKENYKNALILIQAGGEIFGNNLQIPKDNLTKVNLTYNTALSLYLEKQLSINNIKPDQISSIPNQPYLLISENDSSAYLFDYESNKVVLKTKHQDLIRQICISSNGSKLAIGYQSGVIELINMDVIEIKTLSKHIAPILSLSFSSNGRYLGSSARDGKAFIWDSEGQLNESLFSSPHHYYQILKEQEYQVFRSSTGEIFIQKDGNETFTLQLPYPKDLKLSPTNSHLLIKSISGGFFTVDLTQSSFDPRPLIEQNSKINEATFHPSGKEIISYFNNSHSATIHIQTLDGHIKTKVYHEAKLSGLGLSPNQFATFGANESIKIWNLQGQLLKSLSGHSSSIKSVLYNPKYKTWLSQSLDGNLWLWDQEGTLLLTINGLDSNYPIFFSSNFNEILGFKQAELFKWPMPSYASQKISFSPEDFILVNKQFKILKIGNKE